jgi:hypothetical protein
MERSILDQFYPKGIKLGRKKFLEKKPFSKKEKVKWIKFQNIFWKTECGNYCNAFTCRFAEYPHGWILFSGHTTLCEFIDNYISKYIAVKKAKLMAQAEKTKNTERKIRKNKSIKNKKRK